MIWIVGWLVVRLGLMVVLIEVGWRWELWIPLELRIPWLLKRLDWLIPWLGLINLVQVCMIPNPLWLRCWNPWLLWWLELMITTLEWWIPLELGIPLLGDSLEWRIPIGIGDSIVENLEVVVPPL